MDRLLAIPAAIVVALLASKFDLTYVGLAVALGLVLPLSSLLCGAKVLNDPRLGYALVAAGLFFLLAAWLVCWHYGISMDELYRDRSFHRQVRGLPYFAITFLTYGVTCMLLRGIKARSS